MFSGPSIQPKIKTPLKTCQFHFCHFRKTINFDKFDFADPPKMFTPWVNLTPTYKTKKTIKTVPQTPPDKCPVT